MSEVTTVPSLTRLDAALLALRRIVEAPSARPWIQHGTMRVEVSTMLVVDALACAPEGVASVGDIADALKVAHSTASRLVDRAVGAGMVARSRAGDDPRRVRLQLTAEGERLQEAALRFRTSRLAAMLADWPVSDVEALTELLERLAVAFAKADRTDHGGGGPR
jgi:DNA-binding MarR family transcriptional regulator